MARRPYATLLPVLVTCALLPARGHAEGIDTEHLFAFMIGTDTGDAGEREFQSQTTGRFAKSAGTYRALTQSAELEFVPIDNFRVEFAAVAASYDIGAVPGFDDLKQAGVQGGSVDVMQQGGEPGMDGSSSRCVHPCEVRRQGSPALRPDPGLLARTPFGLAPSLGALRFLRRRHRCRVGGGAFDCSCAGLRPPHKLDVQFSRIQLS